MFNFIKKWFDRKTQNSDLDCFPVTDTVKWEEPEPAHVRYAQDFECQNLTIMIAKAKRSKKKFSHLVDRLEARKLELK